MAEGEGDVRVPTISWSPDEAFSPADPMAQGAGGELVHVPRSDSDDGHDDPVREGDVDSWGRSENIRALARRIYDPVYRHWFRAEWEGLEHIPLQGGALLVANHGGAIPSDAPVIMHGIETELRRPVYGLADNLFRALPVVGTLWSRAGGVAAHPDNAYRLLHDEQQLAVVGNEEAMPIIWKSPRLAKLLGLPYFPVTANNFVFGPVLGYILPLPSKFRIRVLPPVSFDVATNQERYNRSLVLEHANAIRSSIQTALYDMLSQRHSVWRG
jgi:1-acyl-sn-glycerol-3-phosphate acyltransferase